MRGGVVRALTRNKRAFAFCLLESANAAVVDENGNRTGEYIPVYKTAATMYANVSPASGYAETEQFGDLADYDHVIVTDWLGCPIDESTVLFLDKAPEFRTVTVETADGVDTPETETVQIPLYDYIVRRVSKSLNSVSIAVSKVRVS